MKQFDVEVPSNTVLTWSLVSGSSATQALVIEDPNGDVIVNAGVGSDNGSNTNSGSYVTECGGTYTVAFPLACEALEASASIARKSLLESFRKTTTAESWFFATDDGGFATVSWFSRHGRARTRG